MEPIYLSIQQKETGKRIKELLHRNGYTVKDIQEIMGFENPQAVYKWLSGKSLPSLDNFLILSKVLHTSIEDILVVDGDIAVFKERRYSHMQNVWEWKEFKWHFKEPWKLPRLLYKNVKYSWQRITKGYCDKDLWSIDYWFMGIMPNMLRQFKETRHGSPCSLGEEYVNEDGIRCNDSCHEEWDKILEEMIFLFSEMNEDTCQKKNIYEKEHEKVSREFAEKYGILGKKLEKHNENHEKGIRVHLPSEFLEYKDIEEKIL